MLDPIVILLFLTLLPRPRVRLYERALIILIGSTLTVTILIAGFLKPIFPILKVDIQSKVISGMVMISTLAPRIGKWVHSGELGIVRLRRGFDEQVGDDMVKFRRSMRKMYVDNYPGEEDPPKKEYLLEDIRDIQVQIRNKHSTGEVLVGALGGTITLLISNYSILGGIAFLLSFFLIVFPISMFLRSVILDTLSYSGRLLSEDGEAIQRHQQRATLRFQQGWNRMLYTNEGIIHRIILVSFLKGEFALGYDLAEDLIEKVLTDDMDFGEAFDKLIHEHLGEDEPGVNYFRRLTKRLLGI